MIWLHQRSLDSPISPIGDRLAIVSVGGVSGPDLVATRANPAQPQEPSPFQFTEIARQAGIDFVHFSGMTAEKHFPDRERLGGGHLRLR